jgi:hypothetical protein
MFQIRISKLNFDGFVKSKEFPFSVIPAEAGIQIIQILLDSCFRRSDSFSDFLRVHQFFEFGIWILDFGI